MQIKTILFNYYYNLQTTILVLHGRVLRRPHPSDKMANLWGEIEEEERNAEFQSPWDENWQPSRAIVCQIPPLPPSIASPSVPRFDHVQLH